MIRRLLRMLRSVVQTRDPGRLTQLTARADEAVRRSRSEPMHVIERDLGIRRDREAA